MQQLNNDLSGLLGSKSKYFAAGRIKPLPVLNEEERPTDLNADGAGERAGSLGKRNAPEVSGLSNTPNKKRKPSRPYAPPQTYAHLSCLPDYLKENLDGKSGSDSRDPILINLLCSCFLWYKVSRVSEVVHGSPTKTSPSLRSSTDGHHYAHPTNHFWKCLHLSGFTGPITAPKDHTLPEKYNLGLVSDGHTFPSSNSSPQTNLIDRPSVEVGYYHQLHELSVDPYP